MEEGKEPSADTSESEKSLNLSKKSFPKPSLADGTTPDDAYSSGTQFTVDIYPEMETNKKSQTIPVTVPSDPLHELAMETPKAIQSNVFPHPVGNISKPNSEDQQKQPKPSEASLEVFKELMYPDVCEIK